MEWAWACRFAAPSSKRMAAASWPVPTKAAAPCSSSHYLSPNRSRPMSDKTVIHVIDDDMAMRDSLAFLLDVNGFAPRTYETAQAFLAATPVEAKSCVVSDIRMPGMNGIELVRKLKSEGLNCPTILIT